MSSTTPFPATLSAETRASIKMPPTTTHPTSSTATIPSYTTSPALHAAALNTIHITNNYFDAAGPYPNTLQPSWIASLATLFRTNYPNEKKYPMPPDPRSLYVKSEVRDGTLVRPVDDISKEVQRVWVKACREVAKMSALEKSAYLRMDWDDHVAAQAKEPLTHGGGLNDGVVVRVFKSWIVWNEYVRDGGVDVQPERGDLESFFEGKDGVRLEDVQRFFPGARDVEMLVWRVEKVARLEGGVYKKGVEEKEEVGAKRKRGDGYEGDKEKMPSGAEHLEVEQSPPGKKQRMEPDEPLRLLKCNGRTKKNKACRLKRRLPRSTAQWNCGRH